MKRVVPAPDSPLEKGKALLAKLAVREEASGEEGDGPSSWKSKNPTSEQFGAGKIAARKEGVPFHHERRMSSEREDIYEGGRCPR